MALPEYGERDNDRREVTDGRQDMPYVKRTVRCGRITEVKKMYTGRVHTAGASRGAVSGSLTERQRRCNDRCRADTLRWLINANFGEGDLHITLHYYDKSVTLDQAERHF